MRDLRPILEHLARSRARLLEVAAGIPEERWEQSQRQGGWSCAEVFTHLTQVESTISSTARKIVEKPPRQLPWYKRLHVPVRVVEYRLLKRRTPIPLDPALLAPKAESVARLEACRRDTLQFVEETRGRELGDYFALHPFLGYLNVYEWLRCIASHEVRHTKQLQEIVESFKSS
jgi:hypothetical protein